MRNLQADRKAPLVSDRLTSSGKLQIRGAGGDIVGPGWVVGFNYDGSDGNTAVVYDNTAGSGRIILDQILGIQATTDTWLPCEDWLYFETGLYGTISASSRLVVYYKLEA